MITFDPEAKLWHLTGQWITPALPEIENALNALPQSIRHSQKLDASGIAAMDTGGAWLLSRWLAASKRQGIAIEVTGLKDEFRELMNLIDERLKQTPSPPPVKQPGWIERLGRRAMAHVDETLGFLNFVGEASVWIGRLMLAPARFRWPPFIRNLETAGVDAIPIVALLSFLIGVVIAYQSGTQLRSYGANVFIVELVGLSILRELAPMMTAIIVAGRTGSAYTAEIGTMKVTEEIDALRTLGIPPMELLILPKIFGLIIALPLLTVMADVAGILGGMVVANSMLEVTFKDFFQRIHEVIPVRHFLVGIVKAPLFALVVAAVGCLQGLRTKGSADSVGRQTTVSVVQSVFLVIVVDAAFSILFNWLDI